MSQTQYVPTVRSLLLSLALVPIGTVLSSAPLHSQQLPRIPSNQRWLEIEQVRGEVTYHGSESRSAQIGDRLEAVGQGIDTANRSSSILGVDTAIGRVHVAQNTSLQVNKLEVQPDGARVTVLGITQGQARVQARRFTNPNSRLEIQSPSGIAAVRGTEFGVSVDADGKMAIATDSGSVEVTAQSQSVQVGPGLVSIIVPGSPPTIPRPLDRQLSLQLLNMRYAGSRTTLKAKVDPANSVLFNGQEIAVNREGIAAAEVALHRSTLTVTVRNPLGETKDHVVWVRNDRR